MGHAGDSGIVLGEQDENNKDVWNYRALTKLVFQAVWGIYSCLFS